MFMVSIIVTSNDIISIVYHLKLTIFVNKKNQLLFMATPHFEWLFNNLHVWTNHITTQKLL